MKKIYKSLCVGIMAVMPGAYLQAQLNGVYTIDNTQAASATNFTSFTQFASTLNAQGVSGPVTVNVGVTSGPYTEQIEIIQYAGASATNSVVINGNGRIITFNATNAALRHTILLSGADYMTWNNLQVIGTNGTNALSVHLWNGADNNKFNNMYIEAPVTGLNTTQVPFSISGSSVSATTSGVSGSGNVVSTSTIIGGYYGTVFYGNSVPPFNSNNEIRNSLVRDFYTYGVYNIYCLNSKVVGNLIDRVNRLSVSTTIGVYFSTGSIANGLIEGNYIRNLFTGIVGSTSTTYGIYIGAGASSSSPNIVRNNVVSDINTNGTLYGVYMTGANFAFVEHNTISLDDLSNTGGTTYGIYITATSNARNRNNNISIGRAGTGTKYGLFYTSTAGNNISDYNNIYISSTAGINYFGSYVSPYSTLNAWQTATNFDQNSLTVDPQYSNPAVFDYAPTNLALNNQGLPVGLLYDVLLAPRSPLAPDPGAYEFFNNPCATAPPSNSFVVPSSSVCPGTQVELTLQNTTTYTNSGYIVQWYASTLAVGGYTAIPGATLNSHVTVPLTSNIYYQAVVTCSNTNQSSTTPPGLMMVMAPTQDTVPYFESFETPAQNGLPNCSWSASSFNALTFVGTAPASNYRNARTGTHYAYFKNHPIPNYFYSNQILLKAGVTYSAALWYITENVGYNPWDEISIHIGTSQNPSVLQKVASETPVAGQLYTLLSNTFAVLTTGYYNVAVRATGGYNAAPYLTWDDLSITIPCSLNSPIISVVAPSAPVCQGKAVTLLAGGANTYSWSNGTQGPANIVAPITHSTYIVHGLNSLSGCSSSVAVNVTVQPGPVVSAVASNSVCSGQSATLIATGADTYFWSTGSTTSITVVSPATSTTYTVSGTNLAGCTSSTQILVPVSPGPAISSQPANATICRGEPLVLAGKGGSKYLWQSPNLNSSQGQVTVMPQSSTVYTLTGTGQNGCSATIQVTVVVDACTGVAETVREDFRIFPNPATEQLFIQTTFGEAAITITDVAGRIVAMQLSGKSLNAVDLTEFSAGIYYVRLQAPGIDRTEKFIKQ